MPGKLPVEPFTLREGDDELTVLPMPNGKVEIATFNPTYREGVSLTLSAIQKQQLIEFLLSLPRE